MSNTLMGNNPLSLVKNMLGLHNKRQQTIAGNIANVNTPYYRRNQFKFEEELQQAIASGPSSYAVEGTLEKPKDTAVRNNGNDVNIDMEMVDLNTNATLYGIYTQIYQQRSSQIKVAIRGGR